MHEGTHWDVTCEKSPDCLSVAARVVPCARGKKRKSTARRRCRAPANSGTTSEYSFRVFNSFEQQCKYAQL